MTLLIRYLFATAVWVQMTTVASAETLKINTEPQGATVLAWTHHPERADLGTCLTPCNLEFDHDEDSIFGYFVLIQKDGYLPFEFQSDHGVLKNGVRVFEQQLMSYDHAQKAERTRAELATLTNVLSREDPAYLEAMTRHYFAAHTAWNKLTYESYKDEPLSEEPDRTYQELLDHYCWPGVERFGATYGSRPDHHPNDETILSSAIEGDSGTVWSVNQIDHPVFEAHHRFRYERIQGHWYLKSVDYRDDDGTYLPIL